MQVTRGTGAGWMTALTKQHRTKKEENRMKQKYRTEVRYRRKASWQNATERNVMKLNKTARNGTEQNENGREQNGTLLRMWHTRGQELKRFRLRWAAVCSLFGEVWHSLDSLSLQSYTRTQVLLVVIIHSCDWKNQRVENFKEFLLISLLYK